VTFDAGAAPAGGADFLERHGYTRGPLLTEAGVFYDVVFRDAPPGEYRFFSVPHGELGMQGRVIVAE
jgi:plastocyanin